MDGDADREPPPVFTLFDTAVPGPFDAIVASNPAGFGEIERAVMSPFLPVCGILLCGVIVVCEFLGKKYVYIELGFSADDDKRHFFCVWGEGGSYKRDFMVH